MKTQLTATVEIGPDLAVNMNSGERAGALAGLVNEADRLVYSNFKGVDEQEWDEGDTYSEGSYEVDGDHTGFDKVHSTRVGLIRIYHFQPIL